MASTEVTQYQSADFSQPGASCVTSGGGEIGSSTLPVKIAKFIYLTNLSNR